MFHRHLNHERLTPAALDDVIDRGTREDWDELARALDGRPDLIEDVHRICRARAQDPTWGDRHRVWLRYIEHRIAHPAPEHEGERASILAAQLHAEEAELAEARLIAAKRRLDGMFLPELHQARWAERLAQLHEEQCKATTGAEREAIEAQISEHYKQRHNIEQTRSHIEESYEMRHFQIRHRNTGAVLWEGDFKTLARCAEAAVLAGTDLTGADFRGADLTGANLSHGKLAGADLTKADLTRVSLVGTDLTGAILDGATLAYTSISRDLWPPKAR